jgi:hypothetical protein
VNLCTVLVASSLLCAAGIASAAKPHQHGAMKLGVAVEATDVTLVVEMPLDSLVGFERAPRSDAERKAAAAALATMRDGAALFRLDAAAQCTLASAKVEAPVLEQAAPSGTTKEHADLDATYVFKCAQPGRLTTLEVLLFDAFKRVERIDVQALLSHGQTKATLRRTARTVRLAK